VDFLFYSARFLMRSRDIGGDVEWAPTSSRHCRANPWSPEAARDVRRRTVSFRVSLLLATTARPWRASLIGQTRSTRRSQSRRALEAECGGKRGREATRAPQQLERLDVRVGDTNSNRNALRQLSRDRSTPYHPCFAERFGGVSAGKETQGWRDSSPPRWSALENLGRRSCRWQLLHVPESLRSPSTG
jgi:hypothetical protein